MERSDIFKRYYVVQFLELPHKDIDEYVCVPSSWIVKRRATDRMVVVSYPVEDPSDTARRVKKRQKFSNDWKLYRCIQQCGTDLYAEAKKEIKEKMKDVYYEHDSNIESEDQEISAEIEKNTSKSKRNAKSNHNKDKPLDVVVSSEIYDQCATKRLKRTALPNADTEPASKRSNVVVSVESDSEVVEQPYPAFECSNKNHSSALKDLPLQNSCTTKISAEKSDERTKHVENRSQKSQSVNTNPLNSTNSSSDLQTTTITVSPEFLTELFMVTRDLHTSSVRTYSLIELLRTTLIDNAEALRDIKKFINETRDSVRNTPTASSSKASPRVENISREKTKEKPQEQNDDNEDDDKGPKKKPNRKCKFVLPPEYDKSDSRWTLKYRELAPGLVELMPHTSVYINAVKLSNCKKLSKDCRSLARMLLVEIFTKSALSLCSLTGSRAKAYVVKGGDVRPGLDENARTVLLAFVEEYGREKGWIPEDASSIQTTLRNKISDMRVKYG